MSIALLERLERELGPAVLRKEAGEGERYRRDWTGDYCGEPLAVVCPRNVEEVSAALRLCAEARAPVVAQGGHTGLVGAATPSQAGNEVIVSLERMNRVRDLNSVNFSMVVEAGCIVEAAQQAANSIDCCFPLSFGAQGSAQIGGAVSTNAGGLNVLRYGMTRELILGLEVVLPDGRIWNGLSTLRKNNTGYDVKQMYVGAEGTLGVVTAAAVRLFPKPTQIETVFLSVESPAAAMALYARARRDLSDLLSAFELLPRASIELALAHTPSVVDPLQRASPYYILMEASASGFVDLKLCIERFLDAALANGDIQDGVAARSVEQAKALWRIREAMIDEQARRGVHLRTDVSVSIEHLAALVETAEARIKRSFPDVITIAYGHVGDGNVHFNALPPMTDDIEEAKRIIERCEEIVLDTTDAFGGSISAEHGVGRKRRSAFVTRVDPVRLDLMHALKAALDPSGVMCPGRVL